MRGTIHASSPTTQRGTPCVCDSLRAVLRDRERELLELKGPCSNPSCPLHRAHSGPCAG